ncbi:LTA synthase family protein [Rheinheimera aquimaris]|uniref:LTA synthase family protein n=1 Tax=Rheinheimera aquimaris TaxID=412437 RepID=UPI0026AAD3C6
MTKVSAVKFPVLRQITCGPYTYLLRMILIGLVLLSAARLGLVLWLYDRVAPTDQLGMIFLQGIRADLILLCIWSAIPVLLSLCWARPGLQHSWFRFSYWWCLTGLILIAFIELSTPAFIQQYDIRPNRLYIEYLKYPKEVFSTLWHGFRLPLVAGTVLTVAAALLLHRALRLPKHTLQVWPLRQHLLLWPLVVFMVFAGIRSTTAHRPANPALFAITSDAMVNSLVINSGYSVLFALYNLKHEARSSEIYGKLPETQMLNLSLNWPWLQQYDFNNAEYPTLHWQQAVKQRNKPLNIVIVLMESQGATFVESLGGAPVTPELEQLKQQGIWFDNLYATGTRSVRGIEAVVAGFMPTPAQSTVKLSNSQQGFTTLASILKKQGYHTQFIYGGEAHFDNMRSFFTGNGFQEIVDLPKINNPVLVGSWGASDEDLFRTAHQQLLALHQQQQPFFSLIFSSSNHEPFEFPDGRISLYQEPKNTAYNAVKYADWSMGRFFEQAMKSPYWQDTLFLVVADHDNRVYGSNLIPVEKFRIPGLILGADTQPEILTTLSSQIDLAPTLLSMAGISSCHPMTGRDLLLDSTSSGRALIQFDNLFALMTEDKLTILKPDGKAVSANYNREHQQLTLSEEAVSPLQQQQALAQVQLPSYLYRERKYNDDIPCESP